MAIRRQKSRINNKKLKSHCKNKPKKYYSISIDWCHLLFGDYLQGKTYVHIRILCREKEGKCLEEVYDKARMLSSKVQLNNGLILSRILPPAVTVYQHTQENIMVGKHHATSRKARRGDRHLAPCKGIREIFYCRIRNAVKFAYGILNPGFWNPGSGIHGVEPRIQDYAGFPYMGRHSTATNCSFVLKNLHNSTLFTPRPVQATQIKTYFIFFVTCYF